MDTAGIAGLNLNGTETELMKKFIGSDVKNGRGILTNVKAAELPVERLDEFSSAPFEFEKTAKWLWDDTQVIYYHACSANRFSDNYMDLCSALEKNIRNLGSFCLTKAVLEKKEMEFPSLSEMNMLELVKMVSFHLRKCHAAFQGIYRDNGFIGLAYLNWEFRWFELGNRLKATEVKIQKIKDGTVNVDSMLRREEVFRGESDVPHKINPRGLNLNTSALPVKGSMARDMLRKEREEEKRLKGSVKEHRKISPVMDWFFDTGTDSIENFVEMCPELMESSGQSEPEVPEIDDGPEGYLTEAEARRILIEEAIRGKDQRALLEIPLEDCETFYKRWMRHIGQDPGDDPPPIGI